MAFCEWCGDEALPDSTFCAVHDEADAPSGPADYDIVFRPMRAIADELERLTETGLYGNDVHETARELVMQAVRQSLRERSA